MRNFYGRSNFLVRLTNELVGDFRGRRISGNFRQLCTVRFPEHVVDQFVMNALGDTT